MGVILWEAKYRSLKRNHKKIKEAQRKQRARQMSAAPNCTTFWSWGMQKSPQKTGCVPLKEPSHTPKVRPYRPGSKGKRSPRKRVLKSPKRKKHVVVSNMG